MMEIKTSDSTWKKQILDAAGEVIEEVIRENPGVYNDPLDKLVLDFLKKDAHYLGRLASSDYGKRKVEREGMGYMDDDDARVMVSSEQSNWRSLCITYAISLINEEASDPRTELDKAYAGHLSNWSMRLEEVEKKESVARSAEKSQGNGSVVDIAHAAGIGAD